MKGAIERAARTLCELAGNPPGATMGGKPLWMDYLPEVRAVVEALREPGHEALTAVSVVDANTMATPPGGARSQLLVGAFIDALLAEVK